MDPFSAGTGALSVISLAIQLGAGVQKLSSFLKSISEAPKEIKSMLEDLAFFETLLARIHETEVTLGPDVEIDAVLKRCKIPIDSLNSIIERLVPGFRSGSTLKRKWTAIEAVMKTEKIVQFREKLQGAKLDLIIAQNISSERISRHRHETLQVPIQQISRGMIEIREIHQRLSFQTQTLNTANTQAPEILDGLSSDIQKASPSWSASAGEFQSMFQAELSKAIEVCVSKRQQDQRTEDTSKQLSDDQRVFSKLSSSMLPRKRRTGTRRSNTTRTLLGKLRCFFTTYELVQRFETNSDSADPQIVRRIETDKTFVLKPSRWMVRLGISQVLQLERSRCQTRCWQVTLRTFRIFNVDSAQLVPDNALIFQFCYDGNLDAVRRLLTNGEASVDDVNGKGETPLHIAAGLCQAEICALLIQEGANRDFRSFCSFGQTGDSLEDRKPFGYVCSPRGGSDSEKINTIRVFLSSGEEIGEASSEGYLWDLVRCEATSQWLLRDVLPAVEPYLLEEDWWQDCLRACLRNWETRMHPCFIEILRNCELSAVRRNLLYFINDLHDEAPLEEYKQKEFELLTKRANGLCFRSELCEQMSSPLSLAMSCGHSFLKFRKLLKLSSWNIEEIAQAETRFQNNGWTEETLLALFNEELFPDFTPYTAPDLYELYKILRCKSCSYAIMPLHFSWDYPFQRRLRRVRKGINQSLPPDEEEKSWQAAWETVVRDFEASVCFYCSVRKHKKKWQFLAALK